MDDTARLTFDKLLDALEALKAAMPVQYYAETSYLEPGKVLYSKSDGFFPDVIYLHPDDTPRLRRELADVCRLVDYHTWKPSIEDAARYARERLAALAKEPIIYR